MSTQGVRKGNTTGRKHRRRPIWYAVAVVGVLVAMTAAWRWSPLAKDIDIHRVIAWAVSLRDNPARYVIILAAYLVGSLLSFPVTLLIVATAFVFGPLVGSAYSFVGCLIGAAATYAVGYYMGKDFVRRLAGGKWAQIEKTIGETGVMAVAAMRLLPVAPFTIVNVMSGALKIPVWNYFLGSLLGLAPGIIIINLFAHQFARAVRNPGIGTYALLGVSILLTAVGAFWLKRRLSESA